MKKKLNYINRSSKYDLYNLAKSINLDDLIIIRKNELPYYIDKYENIIMNLDSVGNGSHWVALNTKHKIYFDSYGQPPPNIVPKSYKYVKEFELQSINGISSTMCGQLSLYFLNFLKKNNNYNIAIKKFYEKFKDIYK